MVIFFYTVCLPQVIVLQPNTETDDNVTPLLSSVAAGSLACLELLIQVLYFL